MMQDDFDESVALNMILHDEMRLSDDEQEKMKEELEPFCNGEVETSRRLLIDLGMTEDEIDRKVALWITQKYLVHWPDGSFDNIKDLDAGWTVKTDDENAFAVWEQDGVQFRAVAFGANEFRYVGAA